MRPHIVMRHPAALAAHGRLRLSSRLELCASIADYGASGGRNKTVQVALA